LIAVCGVAVGYNNVDDDDDDACHSLLAMEQVILL